MRMLQIAERLRAELADGRRLEARLIARDPRRDLALLKVNAAGLVALESCDLSKLSRWRGSTGARLPDGR